MKKCDKCGKIKELSAFPIAKKRNGDKYYQNGCKECKYEYTRQWKAKNRDKVNKADKEWRYKNWEKYLRSQRECYHKNIEERREQGCINQKKLIREYGYKRRNGSLAKLPIKSKCKECGTNINLCVHHKDNQGRHNLNNKLKPNNDISNLLILCRSCHSSLHAQLRKKKPDNKKN